MAVNITPENVMTELGNIKNWKRTSKKNYDVYVCMPKIGTKVRNRLEGADYIINENKRFVISGTVGETWVIDIGKLAKTYSFMDGKPIDAESLKSRMEKSGIIDWMHLKTLPGGGGINWAFHLPLSIKNFPVQTSRGDTLYANRTGVGHGIGDFLVCADAGGQPNLNDAWVVNGEVFPTTYDMRAFPGLVPAGKKLGETPIPKSIVTKADKEAAVKEQDNATKIKKFMQVLNKSIKEKGFYTNVTHDSADGKYEEFGGCDLWTLVLDKNGERSALVSFKDGKLANGTVKISVLSNDLEIIPPTSVKSLEHASNIITKTLESMGHGPKTSRRIQYQVVGRYMNGSEVTGYHLQSIETGKSGKYSKDQLVFLIGRKQITNCTAQLYKDDVIIRGNGMSLNDLPVINEDGNLRNSEGLGNIRQGTSAVAAVEMFNIVGAIKSGRNTVGYVLQNAGCGIKKVKRAQVLQLAQQGKIGNAKVQNYNGNLILRGIGCDLGDLPSENITKQSTSNTSEVKQVDNAILKDLKNDNINKAAVTKLISISQLYYKGNGKFEVALVDFGVANDDLSRAELITELEKFKDEVKRVIGHNFYNTDDVLDTNIRGNNFVYTFDDPYYTSIADYTRAARRLNAEFYLDKNVNITDENSDDLPASLEVKARQELAAVMGH